ncbi:MAG: hypothetical protein DWH91_06665 [Planctomycetota bacterium]|nr:MAG: hypothetical protein DWH91_06665 [Planctomycetota bacterium]
MIESSRNVITHNPLPDEDAATGPSAGQCTVACPACGSGLMEIRHKLQCVRCHVIVETCCEGGRG